jgi:hypothetical protein
MLASVARDWGPTIVGSFAVVASLLTTLYSGSSQRRARDQDHQYQLRERQSEYDQDVALRRLEIESERMRTIEDKVLAVAGEIAGSLSSIAAGFTRIRKTHAMDDLDAIEELLGDAQRQCGRLSLLLGDSKDPLAQAASSAVFWFHNALGTDRQSLDPTYDSSFTGTTADAQRLTSQHLRDAEAAVAEFYGALKDSGIPYLLRARA